jgi:hypothetical protein
VLQTLVIGFAIAISLGLLALTFWVAHAAQANLERRARDAAAGGRPLSLDEQISVARRVRDELAVPALRASDPNFDRKDRDEVSGGHLGWDRVVQRRQKVATAGVVLSIVGGLALGSVAANAFDIHGVERILLVGAATFLVTWCLAATVILIRHRRAGD